MNYLSRGENVFVEFLWYCIVYLYQVGPVSFRYSIQMLPPAFLDSCSSSYVTY